MIIYQAVNLKTGWVYIGKTIRTLETRRRRHYSEISRGKTTHFRRALAKYPREVFSWSEVDHADSLEELNELEKHWIAVFRAGGRLLYNMTDGGDGYSCQGEIHHGYGKPLPEKQRAKISASLREYYKDKPGTMTGRSEELCPWHGKKHCGLAGALRARGIT
jgi:hypothetical protein